MQLRKTVRAQEKLLLTINPEMLAQRVLKM